MLYIDRVEDNTYSLYDLYGHALTLEPLPQGSWNLQLGRPFLGYHYIKLSLSDLCMGVEKKIFKEIMHFHDMNYMGTP